MKEKLDINTTVLSGEIVRDPEARIVGTAQHTLVLFTLLNKVFNGTNYYSVEAWNDVAEELEHLKAGDRVVMSGKFKTGSYKDNLGRRIYTNVFNPETVIVENSNNFEVEEDYDSDDYMIVDGDDFDYEDEVASNDNPFGDIEPQTPLMEEQQKRDQRTNDMYERILDLAKDNDDLPF